MQNKTRHIVITGLIALMIVGIGSFFQVEPAYACHLTYEEYADAGLEWYAISCGLSPAAPAIVYVDVPDSNEPIESIQDLLNHPDILSGDEPGGPAAVSQLFAAGDDGNSREAFDVTTGQKLFFVPAEIIAKAVQAGGRTDFYPLAFDNDMGVEIYQIVANTYFWIENGTCFYHRPEHNNPEKSVLAEMDCSGIGS